MSLPLKSRIARAAVLVAAAAPVIGMGASAAQAAELPANGLTGLSSPETIHNADGAVHNAVGVANEAGTNAAKTVLPAVGKAGKDAAPAAKKLVGTANQTVGSVAGGAAKSTTTGGLPSTGDLPVGGAVPSLGG